MTQHTSMLFLPDALRAAGINVIELDGWKEAQGAYYWTKLTSNLLTSPSTWIKAFLTRKDPVKPTCYMVHHTGTTTANPSVKDSGGNWSKANVWAGLWRDGRLYQAGGGVPTIVFTSAGPARISSGYGHGPTLHEVAADVRVPYRQAGSDTNLAANRYAWNVETVAAGDGSPIDPGVQHALVVMGALLCDRFDWSPWRTIGHLTWTRRKIDPFWDGRQDIIVPIQDAVAELMEDPMFTHFKIGDEKAEWEPIVWFLFGITGGTINANENSAQVQTKLPWKTNVRLVQREDFDLIGDLLQMNDHERRRMVDGGLYRFGKEIAALEQIAYT